MVRKFLASSIAFLLCVGVALAVDDAGKGKGKNKNKGARAMGAVKKVDADAGSIVVAVRSKEDKSGKDQEFKITDATRVTVFGSSPEDKRELTGKGSLKDLKEGTRVLIVHDEGKASMLVINPMKKDKN
jgi:Cu/Ag efflux protein CusF